MSNSKPGKPDSAQPDDVPADIPEAEEAFELPDEGPLPGMPIATDPLLNPMPRPDRREAPELD